MTDTNTAEREAIIRAAVAAMPHTNPLVADDLLGGFTMHTEADDIVAIFQAGRASLAASAGSEPNGYQQALDIRIQQGGWELSGSKVPVLYTDSINGRQVCRDDVWLCTTEALAHPSPPEGMAGWKWVPIEPTDEMLRFGVNNVNVNYHHRSNELIAKYAYASMIAAAPQPPASEAKEL